MYAYILLVLVVVIFSGNLLIGKALNDLPPFTIAFFRLCIASIVLLPLGMRGARRSMQTYWNHRKPFLIITLTGITFFNTFIYGALQFTTATNVAILETVIPIVTVLLSAFYLKERLKRIQWAGVLVSFCGAVWVVIDGQAVGVTAIQWNIGDGIMLGGVMSWAVYSIAVKKYMHLFPGYGALFVMSSVSVLILAPIVAVEWWVVGVPAFSVEAGIGFLYLGIFPSVIALVFYNRAVEETSASKASIFLNLLPVVTMVGAYFWLGERVTYEKVAGAFAVMIGVFMTTGMNKRRKKDE
ncbi:DMT family transporter [Halobacillus litoralis]|uniref:DMT family transporter n=1 Tax=Halobacillus litoralis TaxID=45668 RepID=UPI001CD30974|nr:DMT family transporter [Halobacillus litoralis]MCA0969186.1 DMT family transporter [Halobacillus litoralis]